MSEQKKAIQENALLTSAILEVVTEADVKTLGISEQFNKRTEETVYAREEVHKKITENIVKTAEKGGKKITTEEASTKGRYALKASKNATVRKISDVVLSKVNNPEITDEQIKKNEKVVTAIGKALGYKTILEDRVYTTNEDGKKIEVKGYIDKDTGEIHLSRNAKRPIEWILKHELTHGAENTKAYDNFVKKLVKTEVYAEWLRARTGIDASVDIMEATLNNEVRQTYAKKGLELGKKQGAVTEARQEIIADFVGDMLFNSDTSSLENFLNQLDKPTRNKFIQWVLDVIDKIKNAFAKGDKKLLNEINTLERQFSDMLKDAGKETEKKGTKNDNTKGKQYSPSDPDIRYSLDEDKNIHQYTKEVYNAYGWAVSESILEVGTIERLISKIMELNNLHYKFNKTKSDNQYIIPMSNERCLYNYLIYTDNDAEMPHITKIIEIVETDDRITQLWEDLLNERKYTEGYIQSKIKIIQDSFSDSFFEYTFEDSLTYTEYLGERQNNERKNNDGTVRRESKSTVGNGFDGKRTDTESDGNSEENSKGRRTSLETTDVAKFKPIARKLMRDNDIDGDVDDFASTMPEYTTAYKLSQVASKGGNAYNMVSELAHQKSL